MNDDKIIEGLQKSERAVVLAEQLIGRFDRFEGEFKAFDARTQRNIEQATLSVKGSIFQDRDRYFEKKDKPVIDAVEKLNEKFDTLNANFETLNKWKEITDSDIKKAKWGLRSLFLTILGYFGINIKGL